MKKLVIKTIKRQGRFFAYPIGKKCNLLLGSGATRDEAIRDCILLLNEAFQNRWC